MNSDQIAGKWKQIKGSIQETWGDITDVDLGPVERKKDEIIALIEEKSGQAKDAIAKKIGEFWKDEDK